MGTFLSQQMKYGCLGDTMYYVYIVECDDGTYYTGYTSDISRRINEHNNGTGAKYTRSRNPVELIYYETFEDRSEAMSREYTIKQLSHDEKANLAENDDGEIEPLNPNIIE